MSLRLLLVDDHVLLRQGLRAMLDGDGDVEVVGEAGTGREAVQMARTLAPDVVVMDIGMRDLNGIEATRQIRMQDPRVDVVALSTHSDRRYVLAMLEAGATAYVLKTSAADELRGALQAVRTGKRYLSPDITGIVIDAGLASDAGERTTEAGPRVLGGREREVLQLLAEGLSSKEIAARLHLSTHTVETHRRNIMQKLDLHSIAELTKYAIRAGLTQLDE